MSKTKQMIMDLEELVCDAIDSGAATVADSYPYPVERSFINKLVQKVTGDYDCNERLYQNAPTSNSIH